MHSKKEKLIFWLMGIGCGLVISGVLGIGNYLWKSREHEDIGNKTDIVSEIQDAENIEPNIEEEIVEEETVPEESGEDNNIIVEQNIQGQSYGEKIYLVEITSSDASSSQGVSEKLAKWGIVESSEEFNAYIIDNHKSKLLRPGTFEFEENMTYEEILGVLLRKNNKK